jgi:hypothetical protein
MGGLIPIHIVAPMAFQRILRGGAAANQGQSKES